MNSIEKSLYIKVNICSLIVSESEDSASRQWRNASVALGKMGVSKNDVERTKETISGTTPLVQRCKLSKLMESVSAIYVESARAIARKTSIGEEIFEEAAKKGVKIICGDHPTLFKSPASPIESFIRKVMFAMNEMERDLLVQRLQSGLDAKRQSSDRVGQEGKVKVNGRLSLLEKLKPNDRQKKNMCCMAVQREQRKFGWRVLATKFSKVLKLKEDVSPETARRMSKELKNL